MEPQDLLYDILDRDPRYPLAAYAALHKGLDYTIRRKNVEGHVDGQELAWGMAAYLKEEYGPFARMVLDGWGIRTTLDFGNIVFNLVDVGLMRKQETDTIDCFKDVYSFESVFDGPHDWLQDVRSELGLPQKNPDPSL